MGTGTCSSAATLRMRSTRWWSPSSPPRPNPSDRAGRLRAGPAAAAADFAPGGRRRAPFPPVMRAAVLLLLILTVAGCTDPDPGVSLDLRRHRVPPSQGEVVATFADDALTLSDLEEAWETLPTAQQSLHSDRSEERRVGKEGRCRWAAGSEQYRV